MYPLNILVDTYLNIIQYTNQFKEKVAKVNLTNCVYLIMAIRW